MAGGSDKRTYKIGEVCKKADVQPYVLRYWETEFPALSPSKSGGGQRLYSENEVAIVLRIKQLLYDEGFTIAGAKKRLEGELEHGGPGDGPVDVTPPPSRAESVTGAPAPAVSANAKAIVDDARKELRKLLQMLGDE